MASKSFAIFAFQICVALACYCVVLSSVTTAKSSTPNAAKPIDSVRALGEMRHSFTLDGKPVPPEIFRDMGDGDLADSASILVTVDVKAAIGSNLYYDDIGKDGDWVSQKKIDKEAMNGSEETAYRFIGPTTNKLLVVIASYNGGGSGTFYTLHILDLAAAKAYDLDGNIYQRINLTNLRSVPLGDRWEGDVKVAGNMIDIETTRTGPADDSGANRIKRIEARRP